MFELYTKEKEIDKHHQRLLEQHKISKAEDEDMPAALKMKILEEKQS